MLGLTDVPSGYSGPICGTYSVIPLPKEQAGQCFFVKYEKDTVCIKSQPQSSLESTASNIESSSSNDSGIPLDETNTERKGKNMKEHSSLAVRVRKALDDKVDLYKLVRVHQGSSGDDIKKSFRKLALLYHPDKTASGTPAGASAELGSVDTSTMNAEELHEHFLQVHNAFEILSDPTMRRQYDSHLDFDDSLPCERDMTGEEFFTVCGPAFEKESKWCVKQPVPLLGDVTTPIDEVRTFYKYWVNYESWRDFSQAGEHNLEDAQDREEKRWMQRENWKVVSKLIKKERERVMVFVSCAESRDPRMISGRDAERRKKEEAKRSKMTPEQAAKQQATPSVPRKQTPQEIMADKRALIMALAETRKILRTTYKKWVLDTKVPGALTESKMGDFVAACPAETVKTLGSKVKAVVAASGSTPSLEGGTKILQLIKEAH